MTRDVHADDRNVLSLGSRQRPHFRPKIGAGYPSLEPSRFTLHLGTKLLDVVRTASRHRRSGSDHQGGEGEGEAYHLSIVIM